MIYNNILEGKYEIEKETLTSYFVGISKNQASKHIRIKTQTVSIDNNESTFDINDDSNILDGRKYDIQKIDELYDTMFEEYEKEEKYSKVREIVTNLTEPCNTLLWAYYAHELTMKEIASEYGYSNEFTAKTIKNRCLNKFRMRYRELL